MTKSKILTIWESKMNAADNIKNGMMEWTAFKLPLAGSCELSNKSPGSKKRQEIPRPAEQH
jgi:hypothetical protein